LVGPLQNLLDKQRLCLAHDIAGPFCGQMSPEYATSLFQLSTIHFYKLISPGRIPVIKGKTSQNPRTNGTTMLVPLMEILAMTFNYFAMLMRTRLKKNPPLLMV
jgi:hypothetical protein